MPQATFVLEETINTKSILLLLVLHCVIFTNCKPGKTPEVAYIDYEAEKIDRLSLSSVLIDSGTNQSTYEGKESKFKAIAFFDSSGLKKIDRTDIGTLHSDALLKSQQTLYYSDDRLVKVADYLLDGHGNESKGEWYYQIHNQIISLTHTSTLKNANERGQYFLTLSSMLKQKFQEKNKD